MSAPDDIARKRAVALKWDGSSAPRVAAKGRGHVAQEIIDLARENDVPMHDDAALVQVLGDVDLDAEIPERLYIAIAEVLAFAYEVSGRRDVLGDKMRAARAKPQRPKDSSQGR